MSNSLERGLSVLLTLSAAAIAGILLSREVRGSGSPAIGAETNTLARVDNWDALTSVGRQVGDSGSAIQILEFIDFECGPCKAFSEDLEAYRAEHPSEKIGVSYVHFPLPFHKFARPAARAAECSIGEGKFAAIAARMFQDSDSLGLKPWVQIGRDAGLKDTATFRRCVNGTDPVNAIEAGIKAGRDIGVAGTPTVLINGWRFSSPPSRPDLAQTIQALRAGKRPPLAID